MKEELKRKQETEGSDCHCCSLPHVEERDLSHITDGQRLQLISRMSKVWVNGTNLTYYFFQEPTSWSGGDIQENAVRDAFEEWKNLGIGLTFQEVDNAADAIIKIGFDQNDGSWSYLGRDCITHRSSPSVRTTNFGWDLTTPHGKDTALHELGHVLGFPHEHQNPRTGIVWNESKVYENFSASPNNWSRDKIHWNIIRKIPANTVDGSAWDKDSIMHYKFGAGLIQSPTEYQTRPLIPASGLSPVDIDTVKSFYPVLLPQLPELKVFESQLLNIEAGEQIDFIISPLVSRKYTIQTFGQMDSVMVLFELRNGVEEFVAGDDDSGQDVNAEINVRLHRGRNYIVRTRLYYASSQAVGAIMLY